MSEKEKMLKGLPYRAFDEELQKERQRTKEKIFEFNTLPPKKEEKRVQIIKDLFGGTGVSFVIEPPFHCDYGYNIYIGENFCANYNCTILDCAKVIIGDNVLFGPNVSLFTAAHPLYFQERLEGWEYAYPIVIGDNVWLGGGVIVNPGLKIGNNAVIGSGSVLTKDIPADTLAAGNPCRVIRELTNEEKNFLKNQI